MDDSAIQGVVALVGQLGFGAIALWLLLAEKKDHAATRQELKEARDIHTNDLRDIAGIRQSLRITPDSPLRGYGPVNPPPPSGALGD